MRNQYETITDGEVFMDPRAERQLHAFIAESNKIESIVRPPMREEILEHKRFLALPKLTVEDVEKFVIVVAGKRIRHKPGMNVRIGPHVPPEGGTHIVSLLQNLLDCINEEKITPWRAHVEYETLHPFMDGNGRSGRAIWLWQMRRQPRMHDDDLHPMADYLFLQAFYYQTLQESRA